VTNPGVICPKDIVRKLHIKVTQLNKVKGFRQKDVHTAETRLSAKQKLLQ